MSRSTFCCLPWVHLATHPHGGVSLCCESDHSNALNMSRDTGGEKADYKKLESHKISEIMNSDYFKQVRLQFLRGEIPKACQGCFDKEKAGVDSKRVYENKNYQFTQSDAVRTTSSDGSIETELQFVELRMGNKCNVKCRTCSAESSTKWTKDYVDLQEELPFVRRYSGDSNYSWPKNQDFWQELSEHGPSLKTLYINGGEPTIIKEHWELLERLVATGEAARIRLDYSINMTSVPERAFDLWKNFEKVEVRASIDDLGVRNSYIRHPTKWDSVLTSLDQLKENNIEVVILQTISVMNFYYLDDFYNWAQSRDLKVAYNFVSDPAYLSVAVIPSTIRIDILKKLSQTLPPYLYSQLQGLFGEACVWEESLWSRFIQYTRVLDRIRGEDFQGTFPEFVELCGSQIRNQSQQGMVQESH